MRFVKRRVVGLVAAAVGLAAAQSTAPLEPLSPAALAVAHNRKSLWVACSTGRQVLEVDTTTRRILRKVAVPGTASGLAISPDGRRLYVTCAAPASTVAVIDVAAGTVLETLPAGHTALYNSSDIGSAHAAASYANAQTAGSRTYSYTDTSPSSPVTSAAVFVPASAAPVITATSPAAGALAEPDGDGQHQHVGCGHHQRRTPDQPERPV
ncbi:MAG: hypothetical protein NTY38_15460, partial [Acidobacteria bacterium]|nr:hypothetical protein [Acidobacteriota bacterium]